MSRAKVLYCEGYHTRYSLLLVLRDDTDTRCCHHFVATIASVTTPPLYTPYHTLRQRHRRRQPACQLEPRRGVGRGSKSEGAFSDMVGTSSQKRGGVMLVL